MRASSKAMAVHTEGSVCITADALSCSFAVFHSRSMFAVFVHGFVDFFLCGKSPKAAPFNAHSLSLLCIIVGVLCPMLCCLISVILVQR
jgi:hypothetical protein